MKSALLIVPLLVVACAGSPFQLARMDAEQLQHVSDKDLIDALATKKTPALFQEAIRRQWFDESDIRTIEAGIVRRGMPERAMVAALGIPVSINRANFDGTTQKQFVFRQSRRSMFVYVDAGVVTGWQNEN